MQHSVEELPHGRYVVVPERGLFIPAFFTDPLKAQALADRLTADSVTSVARAEHVSRHKRRPNRQIKAQS